MTQLFRAAAPFVVPGARAGGRPQPISGHRARRHRFTRVAPVAALLAIAGLAGCTDALTDAPARLPAALATPRTAVSGSEFQETFPIPIAPNSLIGTSTFPWTNTGITVPRAGKYRIRVQGTVTVTKHPDYPGPCPAGVLTQFLGEWGPMGRPDLGTHLRVAFYKEAAVDWGYSWTQVDATTIETEQELPANTPIWVARQGLGAEVKCSAHPAPIPMFAFTSNQVLTVTEIGEPKLECKGADGENPVERAKTVRCTITPDKQYKVLSRRATGKEFTVAETPEATVHPADAPYVWEGPAVADSRVSMVLELTGDDGSVEQKTYTADFQIRARDWPKLTLSDPIVTHDIRDRMSSYPHGVWGNFGGDMNQATMNAVKVVSAPSGPNTGLMYMPDPWPAVESTIYMHPAMYNETPDGQAWYGDQNGAGTGTCGPALFAYMVPFAERHEGVTKAPNSHWGIAHDMYQNSDFEQKLEEVYRQTTRASAVRQAAYDVFVSLHDDASDLGKRQAAFDATEYPLFTAGMGCTMDFNRSDP
jgi:hypothetical protein